MEGSPDYRLNELVARDLRGLDDVFSRFAAARDEINASSELTTEGKRVGSGNSGQVFPEILIKSAC